jgi:hypothetical protein
MTVVFVFTLLLYLLFYIHAFISSVGIALVIARITESCSVSNVGLFEAFCGYKHKTDATCFDLL